MGSEFRPILISLLLLGMFAVAIISFGLKIAEINNPSQSIGNDNAITNYISELNNSLIDADIDANRSETALGDSPTTFTDNIIFNAIGGIWKTMKIVPITIYNLTIGLLISKIFGNSFAIVLGVIGTILTITIIFAIWKFVLQGEGG